VRSYIGAFAKLDQIVFVQRLPKTRSGKLMRNLLRDVSNNIPEPRVSATIEDWAVVPEIKKAYTSQVKEL
jgi:propionyl-CoA synthetase